MAFTIDNIVAKEKQKTTTVQSAKKEVAMAAEVVAMEVVVEGLMKELEKWSLELQRHCPEAWNHCSSVLLGVFVVLPHGPPPLPPAFVFYSLTGAGLTGL